MIRCPEGILSASSAEGSEAGGAAFAAVFSTNNGGIDRVFVTNPGSGYRGAISIAVDGYATCVSYALRPVASGSIAKVPCAPPLRPLMLCVLFVCQHRKGFSCPSPPPPLLLASSLCKARCLTRWALGVLLFVCVRLVTSVVED